MPSGNILAHVPTHAVELGVRSSPISGNKERDVRLFVQVVADVDGLAHLLGGNVGDGLGV